MFPFLSVSKSFSGFLSLKHEKKEEKLRMMFIAAFYEIELVLDMNNLLGSFGRI